MIDKRFLLNTYKFGAEAKFVSASAIGAACGNLDMGWPCTVDKNLFSLHAEDKEPIIDGPLDFIKDSSKKRLIPALFSYNPAGEGKPNVIHSVYKKNITLTNNKCIADGIVKTIDVFDHSRRKKLKEYINEKGSIIFSLFTQCPHSAAKATNKNAIIFIKEMLNNIIGKYLYHTVHYVNYSMNAVYGLGDLRFIVHFIDIPNCVPVLNHHKMDGMGMVFNIVSRRRTLKNENMSTIFHISVIMSNYKENIFVIDGIDIREQIKIKPKYLTNAIKIIEKNMVQKSKYIINKSKTKPKKKLEENESHANSIITSDDVKASVKTDNSTNACLDNFFYTGSDIVDSNTSNYYIDQ